MHWRIEKYLEVLKKYRGQMGMLGPAEAAEVDAAHAEIARIQKECHHRWVDVVGFVHTYRECEACGKKD